MEVGAKITVLFLLPILVTPQTMVMVGGGLSDGNAIVYGKIVALAGGSGAKIGVLTMANDDPAWDGARIVDVFNRIYGANATWIPIVQDNNSASAYDPANVELINQSDGIFFGGGVRGRVIRALRRDGVDSPAMTAIRLLLRSGRVLAGSSAGMTSQSSRMVLLSGDTYDCLTFHNYTLSEGGLLTFPAPYVLDAHNSEYGREGRMIRFLFDTKDVPGIGLAQGFNVNEEHALVVTDLYTRPIATVIGTNKGVHFYDVSSVVSNDSPTTDLTGAKTSFYSVDDVIDLTTGEVTIAPWKQIIPPGSEAYFNAISTDDVFSANSPDEWFNVAKRLVDNKTDRNVTSYSDRKDPVQYAVLLDKGSTVTYGGISPYGAGYVYSWENMTVGIRGFVP